MRHWVPLGIFLLLSAGFSEVWWMNRRHGEELLKTQCTVIASQSASRLEEAVRVRLALLQQLRVEWLLKPYTDPDSFRRRVEPILQQFPGFLAINWIDPNGVIRWVVPPRPNRAAVGKDLHYHPSARDTFIKAETTGRDQMSPPVTLYQGGLGIATYFPIRDGNRNLGYLNGVFRIEAMVRQILGPSVLGSYSVRITDAHRILFTNNLAPLEGWRARVPTAPLAIRDATREIEVLPIQAGAPLKRRLVNLGLLLAGLVLAATIALLTRQALTAHQRLRSSETRYRELFEQSMDAIYITTPSGRFVDVNQAAVTLFRARNRAQLLDIDIGTSLYQNPIDRVRLLEILDRDGSVRDYPLHLKALDGTPIFARTSETVARGQENEIVSIRGILHDETETHRMEEELIRVQRLESMSELAGGIAHDFNNILAAIMANASLLELAAEDGKQRLHTRQIQASVESAARLTRQLLEFARGAPRTTELVDLNELVEDTLLILERSIDPNITVRRHLSQDLPAVEGDPSRLQQILLNLLVNARDALPHGGEIAVATDRAPPAPKPTDPAIVPEELSSRPMVKVSVADNGHGMDEATRKRIFEPFFTTKERGKGTGLGLAVAYGVVRDHGGVLRVDSKPGEGSTFTVLLPSVTGKAPARRSSGAGQAKGGTATVLVVDDDADVRQGLTAMLESSGYHTLEAKDGLVALQILRQERHGVEAVILDMSMPGPNGVETMKAIRELDPTLRIILSTGFSEEGRGDDANPPDAYLDKPYGLESLLTTLEEVLERTTPS